MNNLNQSDYQWSTSLLPNGRAFLAANWEIIEQDKTFNTTKFRIMIYIVCHTSAVSTSGGYKTKVAVSGAEEKFNETCSWDCEGMNYKMVVSPEFIVEHDSNGEKTVRVAVSTQKPIDFSYVGGTIDGYEDGLEINEAFYIALPVIPQSSTIIPFNKNIVIDGQTPFVININPLESTYRHDVTYSLGEYSYTVMNVYDSASYTIPLEWLKSFPAAYSKKGIISVETYDDNGEKVGNTVSTYFVAELPDDPCPTWTTLVPLTIENTADAELLPFGYIQTRSTAKVTVKGFESLYGAAIEKITIEGGGYYETFTDFKTDEDGNLYCECETGTLNEAGTNTFTAFISDSRGYISSAAAADIEVNPYSPPTFVNVSSERCENDGTLLNEGTYLKSNVSYIYDDIGGKNSIKTRIYFKASTASEYTQLDTTFINGLDTISTATFDISTAYEIKYVIVDLFSASEYIDVLPVSKITMEFLRGGTGISFGKEADVENAADFGYKIYARRGIMPYKMLESGNLTNGKHGYNLNDYSLFAAIVEGEESPVLVVRPLGKGIGYGRTSQVYTNNIAEYGIGPSIKSCTVNLAVSSSGDSFTATAELEIVNFFYTPSGTGRQLSHNMSITEKTITAIYALI